MAVSALVSVTSLMARRGATSVTSLVTKNGGGVLVRLNLRKGSQAPQVMASALVPVGPRGLAAASDEGRGGGWRTWSLKRRSRLFTRETIGVSHSLQRSLQHAMRESGASGILYRAYSTEEDPDKYLRDLKRKLGLFWLVLTMLAGGGGFFLWTYYNLRKSFSDLCRVNHKGNKDYIYPFDPAELDDFLTKHCLPWLPSQMICTPAAWELIQEITQTGPEREIAIAKLSSFDKLLELDCIQISNVLDLSTAIALANSGADPRLFPASPSCLGEPGGFTEYYGYQFRSILDPLSEDNIHDNLNYLVRSALSTYAPNEDDKDQFHLDSYTGFDMDPQMRSTPPEMSESKFLKVCLQALVSHTRDPSHCKHFLSNQVLQLLMVIYSRHNGNPEIMSLVIKIIANLSCDPENAEVIWTSGCLRVLAEAARSDDVKVLLPAKRALHNLDRESSKHMLLSGVYQLYPDFRCDESVFEYDIVFVHGILGGAFRTWRQQDPQGEFGNTSSPTTPGEGSDTDNTESQEVHQIASRLIFKSPEEAKDYKSRTELDDGTFVYSDDEISLGDINEDGTYTHCWPRDWLSSDCPNARIIAVDYDSFVTHWSGFCPVETTKRSLQDRAEELLQKLHTAGVGSRPIIWVTHSMGGLLTKNLLCQALAQKEYEHICQNTKGIIFYSVPHTGSYIALANTSRRFLFMPTAEALELTNDDKSLTLLHDRFLRLWRAYQFKVLSFGEMLETKSVFKVAFKMVPFSSADPGIGDFYPVKLDHLNTCKPHGRDAFVYKRIVEMIHKIINNDKK